MSHTPLLPAPILLAPLLLILAAPALAAPADAPPQVIVPPPIALAPPADTTAAANSKLGSVFVRCDGDPAHQNGAEIAGRLLLIMATSGLAGPGEMSNDARRLKAAEGVAACDAALDKEGDPVRRVQLTLARAVHRIENGDAYNAEKEALSAPTLAPDLAADRGFQQSLGISALELRAAALVRLNRVAEAEETALEMAELAPWEVVTQQRAARYVVLTGAMTPRKAAFLDRYGRLWPLGLLTVANAREWAGDYRGSAEALAAMAEVYTAFLGDDFLDETPLLGARRAVALVLAGDLPESEILAAQARDGVERMTESGKALSNQSMIAQTEELLDFHGVVARLAQGKAAEARTVFTARSRWLAPTPAAIATLVGRLRQGAPAELTGPLGRDPATIRADALAIRARALSSGANADAGLYAAVRPPLRAADFKAFSRNTWKTTKSPYILKRAADSKPPNGGMGAETIYTGNAYAPAAATPAGEALLLHAALTAKARGKTAFLIGPARKRVDSATLLFGNPGDPGFPASVTLDAQSVIDALSVEIPEPVKEK